MLEERRSGAVDKQRSLGFGDFGQAEQLLQVKVWERDEVSVTIKFRRRRGRLPLTES